MRPPATPLRRSRGAHPIEPRRYRAAVFALASIFLIAASPWAEAEPPALVIEEGSLARQQVVALGRDLVVAGSAQSDVAAVDGSVRVSGSVAGDVIVLGGQAALASSAHVEGDVFVLGGTLTAAEGARIDGRSVSYPTFSAAWLTLIEGPALGGSPLSMVVLAAKLALLAAWALSALLLLATAGRAVRRPAAAVSGAPCSCFVVGLTGVLAMFLTALFFSSFAAVVLGVPLLVLVVVVALLLKVWGMVAVFHALGSWLAARRRRDRRGRARPSPVAGAVLGLLVLGLVKLVPYVGVWVWTAATLIGIGATLRTKFGRMEPWLQPLDAPTLP